MSKSSYTVGYESKSPYGLGSNTPSYLRGSTSQEHKSGLEDRTAGTSRQGSMNIQDLGSDAFNREPHILKKIQDEELYASSMSRGDAMTESNPL